MEIQERSRRMDHVRSIECSYSLASPVKRRNNCCLKSWTATVVQRRGGTKQEKPMVWLGRWQLPMLFMQKIKWRRATCHANEHLTHVHFPCALQTQRRQIQCTSQMPLESSFLKLPSCSENADPALVTSSILTVQLNKY